jgi:TonB family protein
MTALTRHLKGRLGYALLLALILHAAVLAWVQWRALQEPEREFKPLTVQLAPQPERKPKPPAPPKSVRQAPKSTPAAAPAAKPAAAPMPAPAPQPAAKPARTPQPSPRVVTPPPPKTMSRNDAAAAARKAAAAALKPLAPTPDVGRTPAMVGSPTAPVDPRAQEEAPALVKSLAQRSASTDRDSSSTQAALAEFDNTVAEHGVPAASSAPGGGSGNGIGASVGRNGTGSSRVQWDEEGFGCDLRALPEPKLPDSVTGDGTTYHIVVRFRVNLDGRVMLSEIIKGSGISALDGAVLEAARQLSFTNCTRGARGKIPFRVTPPAA